MNRLRTLTLSVVVALFALNLTAAAAASDPAAQRIESFYATLLDTMKRGHELGMRGRYQALASAIDQTFDFQTMIKFIVGPGWSTMSPADQKALGEAFRRMTIANYASNFDSFEGQRFDVNPNVETKAGDRFVESTLVPKADKPIPFIYRMRDTGGGYKAIDIYLNGYVSELTTRRSDFSATLASGGPSALIKKINEIADNSLAGAKTNPGVD